MRLRHIFIIYFTNTFTNSGSLSNAHRTVRVEAEKKTRRRQYCAASQRSQTEMGRPGNYRIPARTNCYTVRALSIYPLQGWIIGTLRLDKPGKGSEVRRRHSRPCQMGCQEVGPQRAVEGCISVRSQDLQLVQQEDRGQNQRCERETQRPVLCR